MVRSDTNPNDAVTVALDALAWILKEPFRAERFVALTGLSPDELRRRIGEPVVLGAALAFLESHEPDLIACADSIGTTPGALVAARVALEAAA